MEYLGMYVCMYDFGGYGPPGFLNLDSVLKRICSQNDTPFLEIGQFLIPRSINLVNFNSPLF